MERWPSGLRRTPGKRVGGNSSGVRIPVSPRVRVPNTCKTLKIIAFSGFFVSSAWYKKCRFGHLKNPKRHGATTGKRQAIEPQRQQSLRLRGRRRAFKMAQDHLPVSRENGRQNRLRMTAHPPPEQLRHRDRHKCQAQEPSSNPGPMNSEFKGGAWAVEGTDRDSSVCLVFFIPILEALIPIELEFEPKHREDVVNVFGRKVQVRRDLLRTHAGDSVHQHFLLPQCQAKLVRMGGKPHLRCTHQFRLKVNNGDVAPREEFRVAHGFFDAVEHGVESRVPDAPLPMPNYPPTETASQQPSRTSTATGRGSLQACFAGGSSGKMGTWASRVPRATPIPPSTPSISGGASTSRPSSLRLRRDRLRRHQWRWFVHPWVGFHIVRRFGPL